MKRPINAARELTAAVLDVARRKETTADEIEPWVEICKQLTRRPKVRQKVAVKEAAE